MLRERDSYARKMLKKEETKRSQQWGEKQFCDCEEAKKGDQSQQEKACEFDGT